MAEKIIRLTESNLNNLIENTVKSILIEKHRPSGLPKGTKREFVRNANGKKETFYRVPNLQQYIDKNGGYQGIASKHQRINARQVNNPEGEYLDTTLADGTKEVQGRHVPQGHWVVNNVGNAESYAIDPKTFGKRYVQDGDNEGVYRPKGNPMKVSQAFKHNVSFPVPQWGKGSVQRIKKGGYGLQDVTNPNDTYGNAKHEFDGSYTFDEMFGENINRRSVRVTESQLYDIIAESVNQILNEIRYNGVDYHGNNPYDWEDLSDIRYKQFGKDLSDKAYNAARRNHKNAKQLGFEAGDTRQDGAKRAYRQGDKARGDMLLGDIDGRAQQHIRNIKMAQGEM